MLGSSMEMGKAPELHPDVRRGQEKFQMTIPTMANNFSYIKYSLKPVPGLPDVGVLQGDGDGPGSPPRCLEVARTKFQMTNLTMPNHFCYMK